MKREYISVRVSNPAFKETVNRLDSKMKNYEGVLELMKKNPWITLREISEKTGLKKTTAHIYVTAIKSEYGATLFRKGKK